MTADANKAESMICMDRAREAIKSGDGEKAKRMLQKAKKLYPDQDITYLLKKADSLTGGASEASSASNGSQERSYAHDDHYEEPHLRSRKPTKNTHQKNGTAPTAAAAAKSAPKSRSGSRARGTLGVDYTQEQVNLVERIRHCKDYYEILAVQKTATDAQIKKEYRKLALNLHPDKCRAPHATEAFKALGSAYAVLSDKSKREQYDLYGPETSNGGGGGGRGGGGFGRRGRGDYFEYDYARGFESEFTADEIFNMFFGGGFPSEAVHRRRQHFHRQQQEHHHHQQREENPYAPLLQLMPLFAILILGMLAQFMVGDPAFQLQQSNKYPIQRTTAELKVPYFVRKDFDTNYRGGRLTQVERQVEDEYVSQLRMNCYKEQNQKETMIYRARIYQDVDLMKRAEKMNMPHCDRLRQIYH